MSRSSLASAYVPVSKRSYGLYGLRPGRKGRSNPLEGWRRILALLALAMTGLLIRALMIGEIAGVLFILGFAALFAWQVGGFVRRNRPRGYRFDRLPQSLLP